MPQTHGTGKSHSHAKYSGGSVGTACAQRHGGEPTMKDAGMLDRLLASWMAGMESL